MALDDLQKLVKGMTFDDLRRLVRRFSSDKKYLSRFFYMLLLLLILSLVGLVLLLFRWQGEEGEAPSDSLYVLGDFPGESALANLERVADPEAEDHPEKKRVCFRIEVAKKRRSSPAGTLAADENLVCTRKPEDVRVGDAYLRFSVDGRGVPRVSVAALRLAPGDWIGSLATTDAGVPHPRFPVRAYGVPGLAARVIACGDAANGAADEPRLCLRIHDHLGRLALRHGDAVKTRLAYGEAYALRPGDRLWLGMVEFEVASEVDGKGEMDWHLTRLDRLRPRRETAYRVEAAAGGDRRWLGRLQRLDVPDPAPEDEPVRRYTVYPMRLRYTLDHLSRQRTDYEGEDVLQRLIDGQWLCLDVPDRGGALEVGWRPLHRPGCGTGAPGDFHAQKESAIKDYRRARFGDLAYLVDRLIRLTNTSLARSLYLEDPTALPLAFQWGMRHDPKRGDLSPQPVPMKLWGVAFGTTHQQRGGVDNPRNLLPEIRPRSSTAHHLIEVWGSAGREATLYLPHRAAGGTGPAEEAAATAAAATGTICHGSASGEDWIRYGAKAGSHLPLGAVAFGTSARTGHWSPNPESPCRGCQLWVRAEMGGEGRGGLFVSPASSCPDFGGEGEIFLPPGSRISLGSLELRYVHRGRPWLTLTDPGDRRRHFSEEFAVMAGLAPLLGNASGLSGVEGAIREYVDDTGGLEAPPFFELTIDGDLQLGAAAIVDAYSRDMLALSAEEENEVKVTAVILDAVDGAVLAAVNWSQKDAEARTAGRPRRPTAWELGSAQVSAASNEAFRRRRDVGSTMKITSSYALLNSDLPSGSAVGSRGVLEPPGSRGQRGSLVLARSADGPSEREGKRGCTGRHWLPAADADFNTGTFIQRFAKSCNNFFVMTGFRHAGGLVPTWKKGKWKDRENLPADQMLIIAESAKLTMVQPSYDELSLAERLRAGLAEDAQSTAPPRSFLGVLYRLGFQPRRGLDGKTATRYAFRHEDRRIDLNLFSHWFSPTGDVRTPALRPQRDFSFPGIPSLARMDESTVRNQATEWYDDEMVEVKRQDYDGSWSDVHYSMLLIGEGNVEISVLGLAVLYGPAARPDGRAIAPCLFRDNCGPGRVGAQVFDPQQAEILDEALREVLKTGTAAGRRKGGALVQPLLDAGWGAKTGTFQTKVPKRDHPWRDWRRLVARLCGVAGVPRDDPPSFGSRLTGKLARLAAVPDGSALGARTCEDTTWPLNPGGVHGYHHGSIPDLLDEVNEEISRRDQPTQIHKSFVAVAPARDASSTPNPAAGLVVAVIVDKQPNDNTIAIKIGLELAASAQRWATLAR